MTTETNEPQKPLSMTKTLILSTVALCAIIPWSLNQLSEANARYEHVKIEELYLANMPNNPGGGAFSILRAEGGW